MISVLRNLNTWNRVGGIEVLNAEIEATANTTEGVAASNAEKDLLTQVELINIHDDDDDDVGTTVEQSEGIFHDRKDEERSEKEKLKEQMDEQMDEETKETVDLRKEFRKRIDQLGRQKQQLKEEHQARKDAEASWLIMRNVEPFIVAQIRTLSSAREMWKKLQSLYLGAEPMQRQHVYRHFAQLTYESCKSMQDYVNEFQELVAQMTLLGRPLSKFHTTHQLIVGLGIHYQAFQDRKYGLGDRLEEQPLADLCSELVDEETKANSEIRSPTFSYTYPTQGPRPLDNIVGEIAREERQAHQTYERSSFSFVAPASSNQPADDVIADAKEENENAEAELEGPTIVRSKPAQEQEEHQEDQEGEREEQEEHQRYQQGGEQEDQDLNVDKSSVAIDEETVNENPQAKRSPISFTFPNIGENQAHEGAQPRSQKVNPLEKHAQAALKRSKAPKKKKSDFCRHCQKYGHNEETCRALHYSLRSRDKNSSDSSKHKEPSNSSSEISFSYTPARNPNRNWW